MKKTGPGAHAVRKLAILAVEDHEGVRRGLKLFLEGLGHVVEFAESVREGLAAARRRKFDLLISDLHLPDGDGWKLMQTLGARRPPFAIAMSGFNSPADLARSKDAGFRVHLVKPMPAEELAEAINEVVREINGSRD